MWVLCYHNNKYIVILKNINNIYFFFKNIYNYNNEQAEDRAFRIGQKNDVNVYYQLFDDTISTRMWDMLNTKKDVISIIMDEKEFTEEEITEKLIEKLYE